MNIQPFSRHFRLQKLVLCLVWESFPSSVVLRLCVAILFCFAFFCVEPALADEVAISRFATEGLKGWESKSFKGSTDYTLVQENGRTVLKAHAKSAASGLSKKIAFQPATYRYLKWSWKISNTIAQGNEKSKQGDDYAARVYVVFPGRFFWQMRALNYIWANKLPKGEFVPNAFTSNAMLIAVESGPSKAGQWVAEERDILADFRRVFGEEPHEAGAIAIMTDTDNTGAEATAWYGDIILSTNR
ncbi:hypothetical protein Glov_1979 [Trichlorobacter lovleyi SZ]|uniref:DUF3047 domain-containing protein n=1 Tax=Trichlorobacter lovleyi (strain ATCC BAA-1151 / DSM 17278 / SZ) TaxID=398767 RepID=B3E2N8_TRIL1|nr:hypothetical protein Glov_1979 [Trichlorobacter lovleyi SZ]